MHADVQKAPTNGLYAALWHKSTMIDLNNKYSHGFWDNQPTRVARTIMRLRWGREYNAKHAKQMNIP